MIETEVIILKTTPFQDTSLIVQGLSPELGRISIYAKAARKISKRAFPNIGLFRVLSITVTEPKSGDLYKLHNCEVIEINDSIAGYPDLVDFASAIGLFSLSSSFTNIPCPLYFHIFKECLSNLCDRSLPFSAWICRLVTCHLMEQGLFPDITLSATQQMTIESLLNAEHNSLIELNLNDKQWENLHKWILKTAEFVDIKLPLSPFFSTC